jgi:hypothetical protein
MEELLTNGLRMSIIVCLLVVNFVLMPNIIFAQQHNNTNENTTESSSSTPKSTENSVFSFYFKEEGGLLPVNIYVLFDNLSKEFVQVNLITDTVSERTLQNAETSNLRDAILAAQFFDLRSAYVGVGADIRNYLLTITYGTNSKTISWNDASVVPESLNNIVAEITNLEPD